MAQTNDSASAIDEVDEELIDTLIAISVVAKRLAAKLRQSKAIVVLPAVLTTFRRCVTVSLSAVSLVLSQISQQMMMMIS